MNNIINPLKQEGHEIHFYLFTYDSTKKEDIIKTYNPTKSTFLDPNYNKFGGGDKLENGMKTISATYINSLYELENEELDLIISTRFDISFNLTYINTIDYEIKRTIFEYIIQLYKPHKFNNLICVNNLYMCKISNTNIIDIINSN